MSVFVWLVHVEKMLMFSTLGDFYELYGRWDLTDEYIHNQEGFYVFVERNTKQW